MKYTVIDHGAKMEQTQGALSVKVHYMTVFALTEHGILKRAHVAWWRLLSVQTEQWMLAMASDGKVSNKTYNGKYALQAALSSVSGGVIKI